MIEALFGLLAFLTIAAVIAAIPMVMEHMRNVRGDDE